MLLDKLRLLKPSISILYTQYHCLPRILRVNTEASLCHSIIFNNVVELLNMFKHHETGSKQTITSPHLPCDLYDVTILGLNFKLRPNTYFINNK